MDRYNSAACSAGRDSFKGLEIFMAQGAEKTVLSARLRICSSAGETDPFARLRNRRVYSLGMLSCRYVCFYYNPSVKIVFLNNFCKIVAIYRTDDSIFVSQTDDPAGVFRKLQRLRGFRNDSFFPAKPFCRLVIIKFQKK